MLFHWLVFVLKNDGTRQTSGKQLLQIVCSCSFMINSPFVHLRVCRSSHNIFLECVNRPAYAPFSVYDMDPDASMHDEAEMIITSVLVYLKVIMSFM